MYQARKLYVFHRDKAGFEEYSRHHFWRLYKVHIELLLFDKRLADELVSPARVAYVYWVVVAQLALEDTGFGERHRPGSVDMGIFRVKLNKLNKRAQSN